MAHNFILAPSIIAADFTHLADELAACESASADWLHVDVMDGHFVPNITMGPFIVEACQRASKLPLDVHLMIENPERYIEAFAKAGAAHIIVHAETCPNLLEIINQIKSLGCKAGVALNPVAPASLVEDVLPYVDSVLVMTVHAGFGGQAFMPEMLPKIAMLRRRLDELHCAAALEVDGGIGEPTLRSAYEAGARAFVAGTAVFRHPHGIAAGIKSLRESIALDAS